MNTDRDASRVYEEATGRPGEMASDVDKFPGLTLFGSFAHDRGAVLSGCVYKGKYYERVRDVGSVAVPDRWHTATSDDERKQIAMDWVLSVQNAWSSSPIEYGGDADVQFDLGAPSRHTFPAPHAVVLDSGEVEVIYWAKHGGGMRPQWRYFEHYVRFSPGGLIVKEGMRHQLVRDTGTACKVIDVKDD